MSPPSSAHGLSHQEMEKVQKLELIDITLHLATTATVKMRPSSRHTSVALSRRIKCSRFGIKCSCAACGCATGSPYDDVIVTIDRNYKCSEKQHKLLTHFVPCIFALTCHVRIFTVAFRDGEVCLTIC